MVPTMNSLLLSAFMATVMVGVNRNNQLRCYVWEGLAHNVFEFELDQPVR